MSDRVRLAAIAAVGLPALALVVAAIVLLLGRGGDNAPIVITPPATPDAAAAASVASVVEPTATPAEIWVHISGRVANPGLYPMQPGQRVADVVLRAGGILPDGDASGLNLARRLTDEAQYHIPALGAAGSGVPATGDGRSGASSGNSAAAGQRAPGSPAASPGSGGSGGGAAGGGVSGGPVNLNRAGAAELETLPGIGPVLAAAILRFRQDNGPFQTIDDLENVPGIGPKTLQRLRPLTTVAP